MPSAAELFVRCLENEGVEYVFGIPGEETLDLNEALEHSESIQFLPVRHEQGAAFMADAYGRLTGRAGVCLGTLGPGATNLVTGLADAYLDRAPVVALTGQTGLSEMHKESHQYIDIVRMMKPVTKWNARIHDPEIIPEAVRKAFAVAEREKPGATHLELPDDVMEAEVRGTPVPRRPSPLVEPVAAELHRAAELLQSCERPVVLAGNGVVRQQAAPALRRFCEQTGLNVITTFMGKGVTDADDPHTLFTAGLRAQDYPKGFMGKADLVVCVGYDLVEWSPEYWNPTPRPQDHLHRHGRGRGRRALRPRRRADRRDRDDPDPPRESRLGQAPGPAGGAAVPRAPAPCARAGLRRRLPGEAAACPARPARGDGPRRRAHLGRRRAQALGLAPLAREPAEHGPDLERRRGDGASPSRPRSPRSSCCRASATSSRSRATAGSS